MAIKLRIWFMALLMSAAVPAGSAMAAGPGQAAKPAVKKAAALKTGQEKPPAAAAMLAPAGLPPGGADMPARVELKIEKLELSAAIKEISQEDAKAAAEFYRVGSDIYVRKQKIDKAISLLETYRRAGGADQYLLSSLANLYMQRGAAKEAVEIWEDQAKLHPEDMGSAMMLLGFYRQKGDSGKELGLLESLIKANPQNPELRMQLAAHYGAAGEHTKAVEAVKKAIELRPQFWYYQQLAQLWLQQDKLGAALAVLEEGVKKLPANEADLTLSMSELCLKKGELEKAEKILKGLLEKVSEPWRKEDIQRRLGAMKLQAETPASPAPIAVPAVSTEPAKAATGGL